MATLEAWNEIVERVIENVSNTFVTQSEFEEIIQQIISYSESPIVGLQYELICPPPFATIWIGHSANNTPDTRSVPIDDNRSKVCRIHYWNNPNPHSRTTNLDTILERLFTSYWKPNLRSPSAGMVDLKREGNAVAIANQTTEYHVDNRQPCSVLFCDLDNFGELNKKVGHVEGDRIIKEFGSVLERASSENAVVLHYGGDEFVLLVPKGTAEMALKLAYKIKQAIASYDFGVQGIQLGISIGIASTEENSTISTYEAVTQQANQALNRFAKKPQKGLARFHVESPREETTRDVAQQLQLAMSVIKSEMLSSAPFASVWLNCLSQVIRDIVRERGLAENDIQQIADTFIEFACLSSLRCSQIKSAVVREHAFDATPSVSKVDLAFAITHGLLAGALLRSPVSYTDYQLTILYDDQCENAAVHLSNGVVVWTSNREAVLSNRYEIGSFWQLSEGLTPDAARLARALLIQIGRENPNIPTSLFVGKIIVDDRPTRGGGLPDFWESAIARLVNYRVRNPNVGAVYVLGNHEHAAQTVAKLRTIEAWHQDEDRLAYKTGLPAPTIREAITLLRANIHFPHNEYELIPHLTDILRPSHIIQPTAPVTLSGRGSRFLRRSIQMEDIALRGEDGCRVETIAQAYPLVLEIVRNASDSPPIRDQANLELRELIDFKVHLINPGQDLVPAFYEHEKDSLEAYFHRQFIDPNGLFRSKLENSEQLESVLNHVVTVVSNPGHQVVTRRAILVIPHEIKNRTDPDPLGLVSIRIIPRFAQGRLRLHFSYSWRTVEALVGFPYSLFGSVRFSQHLTDQISTRLRNKFTLQVEMGEVSYIAHSLHFFMDDYGQHIARRIIDDASL